MRLDGKAEGARQSMSWLHTWVSILLGWLLYAIFLTGTLSFFHNEITLWMQPEKHVSVSTTHSPAQHTQIALQRLQIIAPNATAWTIHLPSDRRQTIDLNVRTQGEDPNARRGGKSYILDSQTGEEIHPRETRGGHFLYRFHFELYGLDRIWARWIVGFATLFMFVAIISGIITHKKIFTDFFTFRPNKGQRSWLDAHNATAVFSLPFLLMITLSGLILLMYMLVPHIITQNYPQGRQQYTAELAGKKSTDDPLQTLKQSQLTTQQKAPITPPNQRTIAHATPQNTQSPPQIRMANIPAMVEIAQQQWQNNPVVRVHIISPNTPNARVEISAQNSPSLAERNNIPMLTFHGLTGEIIANKQEQRPSSVATAIHNYMSLLHQARGVDTVLRWLLFISGLFGTMMIATGLILWVVKRASDVQKAGKKHFGYRLVEILNVATIIGLPIACLSYTWSSRFVPVGIPQRADIEIKIFFMIWLIMLIHAVLRPHRKAWLEQLALATALYLFTPIFNAMTGGRGIWHSLPSQQWILASYDLVCIILGSLFAYTFYALKRHQGLPIKPKKIVKTSLTQEQNKC